MDQNKLLKVLKLEYTSDIRVVYKAAKRYAREVHPDQNPDKKHLWLEFEIAYNVIKKLSDSDLSFDRYTDVLESTPGGKKHQGGNPGNTSTKPKPKPGPQKSQQQQSRPTTEKPIRGADIRTRVKVTFDQIVYGCTLNLKIPAGSAMKDPNLQKVKIVITPTPLWTNKNGSISQKSLNAVFTKKIVVNGYGEKGNHGGLSGNLIITFEVDLTESQSVKDAISEHFGMKNPFYEPNASNDSFNDDFEPRQEESKPNEKPRKPGTGKGKRVRPSVLPKPEFPPKPYWGTPGSHTNFSSESNSKATGDKYQEDNIFNTFTSGFRKSPRQSAGMRKAVRNFIILLAIVPLSVNYVSNNVDNNNSWDATFEICSSASSIQADILWDKFYNYESPYKAAIYSKYFSTDIDTVDYMATIDSQALRIQANSYTGIRGYAQELVRAANQNDTSIIKAMENLKSECDRVDLPWSE